MRRYFLQVAMSLFIGLLLVGCKTPTDTEGSLEESKVSPTVSLEFSEGIYISMQNRNEDFYANSMGVCQEHFYILSSEAFNVEKIQVTLPIETDYSVRVEEITEEYLNTTEYIEFTEGMKVVEGWPLTVFPRYLYDTYCGKDWDKMKELYLASKGIGADDTNSSSEMKKYDDYNSLYWEEFSKLTREQLPTFYVYNVNVTLGMKDWEVGKVVSEVFQTIEIQIGEKTYVQDIGEIRIHGEEVIEIEKINHEVLNKIRYSSNGSSYPWGDGKACVDFFYGQALQDLRLDKVYINGESSVTLLGANVKMSKKDFNDTGLAELDMYWDFATPIEVEAGTYIEITLFVQDPEMKELEYSTRGLNILEYTVGEKSYMSWNGFDLERHGETNIWTTYALLVNPDLKEEMEQYFEYYRVKEETWRENLPW